MTSLLLKTPPLHGPQARTFSIECLSPRSTSRQPRPERHDSAAPGLDQPPLPFGRGSRTSTIAATVSDAPKREL
jgi:hypothetical protein